jgi:hypothetical protein
LLLDVRGNPLIFSTLPLATIIAACAQPKPLGPAAYVPPAVGTVYEYADFKNTVLASNGWRVRFADDSGRQATHVAVFITDDPTHASQIDSVALAKLWPLEKGKETTVKIRAGSYVSRWMGHVVGQAQVAVPAGTFDTYVVQAVQRPEAFTDDKKQTMFLFTFWYAPSIAAVVQYETRYYAGPGNGTVVRSVLLKIDTSHVATTRAATKQ